MRWIVAGTLFCIALISTCVNTTLFGSGISDQEAINIAKKFCAKLDLEFDYNKEPIVKRESFDLPEKEINIEFGGPGNIEASIGINAETGEVIGFGSLVIGDGFWGLGSKLLAFSFKF